MLKLLSLLIFAMVLLTESLDEWLLRNHRTSTYFDGVEPFNASDKLPAKFDDSSSKQKRNQKGVLDYQDTPEFDSESKVRNQNSKTTPGLTIRPDLFLSWSHDKKKNRVSNHIKPNTEIEMHHTSNRKVGKKEGSNSSEPVQSTTDFLAPDKKMDKKKGRGSSGHKTTKLPAPSQKLVTVRSSSLKPVLKTMELAGSSQKPEMTESDDSSGPVPRTTKSPAFDQNLEKPVHKITNPPTSSKILGTENESTESFRKTTESSGSTQIVENKDEGDSLEPAYESTESLAPSKIFGNQEVIDSSEPVQTSTESLTPNQNFENKGVIDSSEPVHEFTESLTPSEIFGNKGVINSSEPVHKSTESPDPIQKLGVKKNNDSLELVHRSTESPESPEVKSKTLTTTDSHLESSGSARGHLNLSSSIDDEEDDYGDTDYQETDSGGTNTNEDDSEEKLWKHPLHQLPSHESIAGGKTVSIKKLPYLAIVYVNTYIVAGSACTSAIITPKWVLTAAHCVRTAKPGNVLVIAGLTKTYMVGFDDKLQMKKALKVIIHPHFIPAAKDPNVGNHDIALIKLEKPFFVDKIHVATIRLRGRGWFVPSRKENCTAAGWGREGWTNSNPLLRLKTFKAVAIHGEESCPCVNPDRKKRIVCLERTKEGEGVCAGDSGGPLVCDGQVVGVLARIEAAPFLCQMIFSQDFDCGTKRWIDIYTYTCHYLNWIRRHVGKKIPAQPASCAAFRPIHQTLCVIIVVFFRVVQI